MLSKERLKQKAKEVTLRFMRYNQGFVAVILSLAVIYVASSNKQLASQMEEKDDFIKTLSNKVVYVSDAGVVKQYEAERLDVSREQGNVQNVLSRYMVQSLFVLSDGYKKAYFASPEELFKSARVFQDFFKEYIMINQKNATQEQRDGFKIVSRDFEQIMTYFRNAINANNLPHILDKKDSAWETRVWETQNETFHVRFLLPLYAKSRNNNNVLDEGAAYAEIEAKGYFNLLEGSTLNPRGMKFTSLRVLHPEIDHAKRAQ